jgi:hypothetical protein
VIVGQLPGDIMWYKPLQDASFLMNINVVSVMSKGYEDGLYAYFKPTSHISSGKLPYTFREPFDSVRSSVILADARPLFYPFDQQGFIVARVTPPLGDGLGSSAAAFVTACTLMEITTTSQFFEVEQSFISAASVEEAIEVIKNKPQFFDNPFHWSDIRNFVNKALGSIAKHGPTILEGAAGLASFLAKLGF